MFWFVVGNSFSIKNIQANKAGQKTVGCFHFVQHFSQQFKAAYCGVITTRSMVMNLKVRSAINDAKEYSIWILSAIAIIVVFKVALSPEPFDFFVFIERFIIVAAVIVPTVYILLFLGFYFGLINKNNDSE